MQIYSRLLGVAAGAAALAMFGCSANSGVGPMAGPATQQQSSQVAPLYGQGWIQRDGVVYHTPHYMATSRMVPDNRHARKNPNIVLSYQNGPVLVKPKLYLIFWGFKTYGDPDKVKPLLKEYAKVLGGSPLNNIYTQYYEVSGSKQISIKNERRQSAGSWEDDKNPVPASPSDAQVAAEALNGVAHFGYDANGSYVVATPHGHSSAGFGQSFCAYHSAAMSSGKLVSYTNLPYMPDSVNCGSNWITPPSDESGVDEGVTIVEGHEYGESVTDPNPPTGWYNFQEGEIGDICAWINVQNDPFGTHSYSSQPMFSNATQSCVHSL